MQLPGKVAIVTGASSGIGSAAARLFAQEGARVVAVTRRRPELERLVAEIAAEGGEAVVVAGGVRHESTARAAVEAAVNRLGGLDIALNNAATMGKLAAVADLEPRAWQEVLDVNLGSAFLGARHQTPAPRPEAARRAKRDRARRCSLPPTRRAS